MWNPPESDQVTVATPQAGWTPPAEDAVTPKSMAGLAKNAVSDIDDIATGAEETIKKGAYDLPKDLTSSLAQTVGDVVTGKDSGQTPIGKETTDFANNAPALGASLAQPITHPIDYGYQHPVSQA